MKKLYISLLIITFSIIILGIYLNKYNKKPKDDNTNIVIENKHEEDINENKEIINNNTITLTIGNSEFEVILEENETTYEILKLLPLDINMDELNNNEKYYYFDKTFPSSPIDIQNINSGDIMLYGNNCLVLFYKDFTTTYKYTKIGRILNVENFQDVVGNKNVIVKIKKSSTNKST